MEALDPQSPGAKELSKTDVAEIIREEIEKICTAATLGEISGAGLLISRLRKAPRQQKGPIKADLKRTREKLVTRVRERIG